MRMIRARASSPRRIPHHFAKKIPPEHSPSREYLPPEKSPQRNPTSCGEFPSKRIPPERIILRKP